MRSARVTAIAASALGAFASCATYRIVHGVQGPLRTPASQGAPAEVFGDEVFVRSGEGDRSEGWHGELLGCDGDGVYLLVNVPEEGSANRYWFLRWSSVTAIRRDAMGTWPAGAAWSIVSSFGTIGMGYHMLWAAPAWAVLGTGTTAAVAHAESGPRLRQCQLELRRHSRFPGDIPRAIRCESRPVECAPSSSSAPIAPDASTAPLATDAASADDAAPRPLVPAQAHAQESPPPPDGSAPDAVVP